ncbi:MULTISPECIES: phage holin family protein [unclassified Devosia]|uniref:phage holin family protein n=1 Tax=unclassified Devosia TaxID=196773 RepID=UPI00145F1E75|nr:MULTISPECIES: phage holin family protein [unclassified Devosia]MBJ6989197.1 phage holin family protein [Devosia sp. MC521]QMW62449.1 phage holin family protein [Devosia sp. MC521]
MSAENRPIADLLGGLVSDVSTLFRKEVQLAKLEASEKVSETMSAAGAIVIGSVLALGALGVFLAAVVTLLTAVLISLGFDPIFANSIAAGVVTLVVGMLAWNFIAKGLHALKASNLSMNRTAASLSRDADIVKERL